MAGEEEPFLPPSETGDLEPGVRYELSPDGHVRIVYVTQERRHGETWEEFNVELAQRNRHLFSLPFFFEANVKWTGPRTFAMFVGEAYSAGHIRVDVDVDANSGKGHCVVAESGQSFRCVDAERLIKRAYDAHVPTPPRGPIVPQHSPELAPKTPDSFRQPISPKEWFLGLSGAAAIIGSIALGTYWWHEIRQQAEVEERLLPPPEMKRVEPPSGPRSR